MATAPEYTAEAPPPPYDSNRTGHHIPLIQDTDHVRRPGTAKDRPAHFGKHLVSKWGMHARQPYRFEIATLMLTVIAGILALVSVILAVKACGDEYRDCDGLVFAVNLILPPLTIAHSAFMMVLIRISPAKIAAHRRLLHRPTPTYSLVSSVILMCLWVAQGMGWMLSGFTEDYASAIFWYMKLVPAFSVAFVQVLYLGYASDALCGKDAVRRRRQRKADRRVAELGVEERMSGDVELGRVAVQ